MATGDRNLSTNTTDNYINLFRLQKLMIDGGFIAFGSTIDQKLKNEKISLRECLNQAKEKIKILNKTCVITDVQYEKLFPDGGKDPCLDDTDITLMACLLTKVDTLISAAPDVEEDLEKLITYNNKISRVSSPAEIDEESFENYWNNFERVLARLSDRALNIKETIKGYKTCSFDSEEERRLKEGVKTWREAYYDRQKHEVAQVDSSSYSWYSCLKLDSESEAENLIKLEILPSKEELKKACRIFGRHSSILNKVCTLIGSHIRKESEEVLDVFPSYQIKNELLDSNMSIVFVVIVKMNSTFIGIKDYEYHKKYENIISDEGNLVASESIQDKESFSKSNEQTWTRIRHCINEKAGDLFKRHSNLNVILPSLKKSTGYGTTKHKIKNEPCIAFHVTVKGYIPLNEEPFEKEIGGFKIDVLEEEFKPLNGKPDIYHEHLKIGLEIHAKDDPDCGTLGGFVHHSKHELCGITCAHVLYDSSELEEIKDKGLFKSKDVCQPNEELTNAFGKVVEAIVEEGSSGRPDNPDKPGLEIALIKITKRHPDNGSFPDDPKGSATGCGSNNQLSYNSGEVCESSELKRGNEVFKFGISSGITKGIYQGQGGAVRRTKILCEFEKLKFHLLDQLVISPHPETPKINFVEEGDSGALVLKQGKKGDSVAIGIVQGRSKKKSTYAYVTPICDILRAVGCSASKMHHFTEKQTDDSGVN